MAREKRPHSHIIYQIFFDISNVEILSNYNGLDHVSFSTDVIYLPIREGKFEY